MRLSDGPSLERDVQLPNYNILVIIGIAGETGQGLNKNRTTNPHQQKTFEQAVEVLFRWINAAEAQVHFVFTGEHFQSVPVTAERDYTETNELQYIMSGGTAPAPAVCYLMKE